MASASDESPNHLGSPLSSSGGVKSGPDMITRTRSLMESLVMEGIIGMYTVVSSIRFIPDEISRNWRELNKLVDNSSSNTI